MFQSLRSNAGIQIEEYVHSVCADAALREMTSPGKSGAGFFISHNDRFIIKTLTKEEMKTLKGMLPKYYRHCQAYPHTMLTKLYGMHRVEPLSAPPVGLQSVVFSEYLEAETGGNHKREHVNLELYPWYASGALDILLIIQSPDLEDQESLLLQVAV